MSLARTDRRRFPESIFEGDFDSMLTSFFGRPAAGYNPPVDVMETEADYRISFDLPGIKKEELEIEVRDNQLLVSGERRFEEQSTKEGGYFMMERRYGKFQRVFNLPTEADASKIEAAYNDGVLLVSVPKKEGVKPQKIKVGEGKGPVKRMFEKVASKGEAKTESRASSENVAIQ